MVCGVYLKPNFLQKRKLTSLETEYRVARKARLVQELTALQMKKKALEKSHEEDLIKFNKQKQTIKKFMLSEEKERAGKQN